MPRDRRTKAIEWTRRYLPLELAGWVGELGSAWIAYALTGSLAVAAVVATVGSAVSYYIPAYVNAVRWSWPTLPPGSRRAKLAMSNLLAVRSITVEFGAAEALDSVFLRPVLYYAAPVLLGNVWLGWVVGGFAADAIFYLCTIFCYERFGRWLARPGAVNEPEPVLP
ncbi:MAG: hypothetical protein ACRDUB_20270 [Mycobacterium sp.]